MMDKNDFRDTLITAFLVGVLIGIIGFFGILVLVRNLTAEAAEIQIKPEYIEITDGPESAVEILPELEELGEFTVTYYCPCGRCNGYFSDGSPRSVDRYGNPLEWGTVAVDPKVIPMHTKLVVDGYDMTFEARDTGGKWVQGKHIDIFVPVSHKEALKMGQGESLRVWKVTNDTD